MVTQNRLCFTRDQLRFCKVLTHWLCLVGVVLFIVPLTTQAVAGLLADARQVVEVARDEASSYRSSYGNPIPLKASLVASRIICTVKLVLTIICEVSWCSCVISI